MEPTVSYKQWHNFEKDLVDYTTSRIKKDLFVLSTISSPCGALLNVSKPNPT